MSEWHIPEFVSERQAALVTGNSYFTLRNMRTRGFPIAPFFQDGVRGTVFYRTEDLKAASKGGKRPIEARQ